MRQRGPLDELPVRIHVSPVKARVIGHTLRWSQAGQPRLVPAKSEEALLHFCRLRKTVREGDHVKYAERWGVLGEAVRKRFSSREYFAAALAEIDRAWTLERRVPEGAQATRLSRPVRATRFPRDPRVLGDDEPLWLWRVAAAKTRALAVLYVALVEGRPDLETDRLWQAATVDNVVPPPEVGLTLRERRLSREADQRRERLDLLLDDWWHMSDVRETLNKEVYGSGAIGAAMALVWVGLHTSRGLAVCDLPTCREAFLPRRKRANTRLSFCPDHAGRGRALLSKWKSRRVLGKHLKAVKDGDE